MFNLFICSKHQMYISRCLSWPVVLETRCTFFCFFCSVSFLETCSKCMCLNCSEFLDTRCTKIPKGKSEASNRVRNRKPKKARHCNEQKKNSTSINKGLENTTQKTKDRATRIPLNHGVYQCA